MFIHQRTINAMLKGKWGCHHIFGRVYLVKRYSPATKGIKSLIWDLVIVKKD